MLSLYRERGFEVRIHCRVNLSIVRVAHASGDLQRDQGLTLAIYEAWYCMGCFPEGALGIRFGL